MSYLSLSSCGENHSEKFPLWQIQFLIVCFSESLDELVGFFFSELILFEYLGDKIYGRVSIRRFGDFSKLGRFELVAESSQGG